MPDVPGRTAAPRAAGDFPTTPATPTEPRISCLIATVPRSGSWLLAEALHKTGVVGQPEEYFRPDYYDWWLAEWGVGPPASYLGFIREARAYSTTPNGVFSAKLHWYQFRWLLTTLRAFPQLASQSDAKLVESCFPRPAYVFLTRRDHARQAVSYYRAIHTNEWFKPHGDNRDNRRPDSGPGLSPDFQQVRWLEDLVARHESHWEQFFADSALAPLRITYEQLTIAYGPTVESVLDFLGIERGPHFALAAPGLQKQGDEHSERWLDEYLTVREELLPLTDEVVWADGKAFVPTGEARRGVAGR